MNRFALFAVLCLAADYNHDHAKAVAESRPMVVGIGCAAPHGDWITTSVARMPGYKGPCIVVSRPGGDGSMHWVGTLPASATAAEIGERLKQTSKAKWNPYTQPNYQERMRRERSGADTARPVMGRFDSPIYRTAPLRSASC